MTAADRALVRSRAGGRCEYCRLPEGYGLGLHVEHIRPLFHQGADDASSLALACAACNWRKGTNLTGFDPDSGVQTPLFNPRMQVWGEHFRCDGARIQGRTPAGRTTAWVLDFNDEDRLELRSRLRDLGFWP